MSHAHVAAFCPVGVFVLTCSDTRTLETDVSGALAATLVEGAGHVVVGRAVVPDEPERIEQILRREASGPGVDAVIVNGGTGLSRRDRTNDALERLLDKRLEGFGELFRMLSYAEIGPAAMLSRATAGLWDGRVVFSVPGSPAAVRLALEKLVLPELNHLVREARR